MERRSYNTKKDYSALVQERGSPHRTKGRLRELVRETDTSEILATGQKK